ncbi:hypothetical protein PF008_g31871 [Phytophthora fragariae]|uniref:RxLR effector protein n=1 Tax=Phytophthora fragariae TaxID=53985 RepID=A0A6G0Q1E0_9STRA|nr:hypothetical protein PF008_g31871 [Phytophthora fragariae]
MRFLSQALLGAFVLTAATFDSALAIADSKVTAVHSVSSGRELPAHQNRTLRAADDEEERLIIPKTFLDGGKLDKLTNLAKTGVSKLDKAGDDLLRSPKFSVWVSYMTSITKEHPKTAIVKNLASRYGDDTLARMLEAAKRDPGTTKIATRLQVAQMRDWIRGGKSFDDVLALLKLDDGVDKILANPTLGVYINQFNKINPGKQTNTIDRLTVQFGDEALAKMLEAAKKVPSTEKLAKELQVAQFAQWLAEGAKPANIWKMLNMEKATWMKNPDADVFYGYVAFYKSHKSIVTPTTP